MAPILRLGDVLSYPLSLCHALEHLGFHPDGPTPTTPPSAADLRVRQGGPIATVTVSSNSGNNGGESQPLSGGAIAGIVIGSIAGFLLLLWIIRSCGNLGAPPQERQREDWVRRGDSQ